MSNFIEDFVEWAEEAVLPFKEFIIDNYGNPILWIALLGLGIFLFGFTYSSLNKN